MSTEAWVTLCWWIGLVLVCILADQEWSKFNKDGE